MDRNNLKKEVEEIARLQAKVRRLKGKLITQLLKGIPGGPIRQELDLNRRSIQLILDSGDAHFFIGGDFQTAKEARKAIFGLRKNWNGVIRVIIEKANPRGIRFLLRFSVTSRIKPD